MRIAEIENQEVLTEGKIGEFFSFLKDMSSDFKHSFKTDSAFRTLIIGTTIALGLIGGVSYMGWKEANYYENVDAELHEMYEQYAGTNKYLDFEQEFEKYLALKAVASQKKTETYTYYDASSKSTRLGTRVVPKYPEKVAELAKFTKMLIEKYNIVVDD